LQLMIENIFIDLKLPLFYRLSFIDTYLRMTNEYWQNDFISNYVIFTNL